MKQEDYFTTLGVSRNADADELKRAYRRLARKYHPDVSKEPDAEEKFKRVQEAYDVLKDPDKRELYEAYGAQWQAAQQAYGSPGSHQPFEDSAFTPHGSFEDVMEQIFGARGAGRRQGQSEGWSARGEDITAEIEITLHEAFNGTTRSFNVAVPRWDGLGRFSNQRRTLQAKIPAGVRTGQKIRLAGQGHPGAGGAPDGDLYLKVNVRAHAPFEVDGRDVHVQIPVAPWEAALGATVEVPTLGGKVELKVPPGSQAGSRLRLRGKGLPGNPAGDQFVQVEVVMPDRRTERGDELWQALAAELSFDAREGLN